MWRENWTTGQSFNLFDNLFGSPVTVSLSVCELWACKQMLHEREKTQTSIDLFLSHFWPLLFGLFGL